MNTHNLAWRRVANRDLHDMRGPITNTHARTHFPFLNNILFLTKAPGPDGTARPHLS